MLNKEQREEIADLVEYSLDKAEEHWENGGKLLLNKSAYAAEALYESANVEPSKIPGAPIVRDDETVIKEFIALVADMRGSSQHLMCALSQKTSDISGLQRVYYETSALLPALGQTIDFKSGRVTEYLGDGVLALFEVDENDKDQAVYSSYRAAKSIIGDSRDIVNDVLGRRYNLPEIDIGVGLAISKTIVTLVGLDGDKHPKAFGECVFRATKLSSGKNRIAADEYLYSRWPKASGKGGITFKRSSFGGFDGFIINK